MELFQRKNDEWVIPEIDGVKMCKDCLKCLRNCFTETGKLNRAFCTDKFWTDDPTLNILFTIFTLFIPAIQALIFLIAGVCVGIALIIPMTVSFGLFNLMTLPFWMPVWLLMKPKYHTGKKCALFCSLYWFVVAGLSIGLYFLITFFQEPENEFAAYLTYLITGICLAVGALLTFLFHCETICNLECCRPIRDGCTMCCFGCILMAPIYCCENLFCFKVRRVCRSIYKFFCCCLINKHMEIVQEMRLKQQNLMEDREQQVIE